LTLFENGKIGGAQPRVQRVALRKLCAQVSGEIRDSRAHRGELGLACAESWGCGGLRSIAARQREDRGKHA
jgi:hypothetical protein